jgi:restriction system protein
MSRRRNDGIFEMLVDLPWWVGVIAAATFYVLFGWILPAGAHDPVSRGVSRILPAIGQAFALICLVAAAVSGVRSGRRRRLLDGQSDLGSIRGLSWRDFERLVGEAYRRRGYEVRETGGGGADGGVDLMLYSGGEKTVVQCKRWRERLVGVSVVREVYGVMVSEGAVRGIVVTAGAFSPDAVEFVRGKNLTLVPGDELTGLVRSVQREVSGDDGTTPSSAVRSTGAVPACPVCGMPMARRTARRGRHAGSQFWGCPRYPACKGTRKV